VIRTPVFLFRAIGSAFRQSAANHQKEGGRGPQIGFHFRPGFLGWNRLARARRVVRPRRLAVAFPAWNCQRGGRKLGGDTGRNGLSPAHPGGGGGGGGGGFFFLPPRVEFIGSFSGSSLKRRFWRGGVSRVFMGPPKSGRNDRKRFFSFCGRAQKIVRGFFSGWDGPKRVSGEKSAREGPSNGSNSRPGPFPRPEPGPKISAFFQRHPRRNTVFSGLPSGETGGKEWVRALLPFSGGNGAWVGAGWRFPHRDQQGRPIMRGERSPSVPTHSWPAGKRGQHRGTPRRG